MTNASILKMPDGFLWGAATAAHQNEGGNRNNQWAAWEQQPGRIHEGQRAGKATDWWNLETAAADFDRAAELGAEQPARFGGVEPDRAGAGRLRPDRAEEIRRDDRPAARPRHHADGHAAPLHRPALADRSRRVGEPGGRDLFQPFRDPRGGGAGRPGDALVHHQRADRLRVRGFHGRVFPSGRQ